MIKYIRYITYKLQCSIYNKHHGERYYKFVNPDGHNGVKYKEGWNHDPLEWDSDADCKPGGLYFTDNRNILKFTMCGNNLYEVVDHDKKRFSLGCCKYKSHSIELKLIGDNAMDIVKHILDYRSGIVVDNMNISTILLLAMDFLDFEAVKLVINHARNTLFLNRLDVYSVYCILHVHHWSNNSDKHKKIYDYFMKFYNKISK